MPGRDENEERVTRSIYPHPTGFDIPGASKVDAAGNWASQTWKAKTTERFQEPMAETRREDECEGDTGSAGSKGWSTPGRVPRTTVPVRHCIGRLHRNDLAGSSANICRLIVVGEAMAEATSAANQKICSELITQAKCQNSPKAAWVDERFLLLDRCFAVNENVPKQ